MAIKILTKNGVENTNIDGARANYIATGRTVGVIKDVLKEANLFTLTDSYVAVNPCELSIYGHRVVITEPEYITTSGTTARSIPYFLMGNLTVTESSVEFRLSLQNDLSGVSRPNWFSGVTGVGGCKFALCRFWREGTKNSQLTRLIESITGSVKIVQEEGDDDSVVMSQKATTEAIEKGIPEKVVDSNVFRATLSIHTRAYLDGEGGAVKLLNQKISTDSPLYQTFEFSGAVYGDYSGTATCRLSVSPSDLVKGGLLQCAVRTVFDAPSLGVSEMLVWLTPAPKQEIEDYEYSIGDSRSLYHIDIEKNSAYYNALNLLASKDYYGNSVFSNSAISRPTGVAVAIKDVNPLNPKATLRMQDSAEATISLYGKNLLDLFSASPTSYGSFYFTDNGELVWQSGGRYYIEFPISIPAGVKLSVSFMATASNSSDAIGAIRAVRTDGTDVNLSNTIEGDKVYTTKTLPTGLPFNRLRLYKSAPSTGLSGDMYISNLQVELGDVTEYTSYIQPTKLTIPAEGLDQVVPTQGLTVIQNPATSVRIVEATYAQDINSALLDLKKRLSSLESASI